MRRPVADFASEGLWQPLGAESNASWNIDATGREVTFAYYNAVLRDWARLGLMLVDVGPRREMGGTHGRSREMGHGVDGPSTGLAVADLRLSDLDRALRPGRFLPAGPARRGEYALIELAALFNQARAQLPWAEDARRRVPGQGI